MRLNSLVSAFLGRDSNFSQPSAPFPHYSRKKAGLGAIALALSLTVAVPVHAAPLHFSTNPQPHSVVVDWVEAMLLAVQSNPPAPTATTWRMLVVTTAMYDAWSAYDQKSLSVTNGVALKREPWEHTDTNKEIAVSHAAYHALSRLFPNQRYIFDEVMAAQGLAPSESTDVTTPEGIGKVAATKVVEARLLDGSNAANGFRQITSSYYPSLYAPVNSANPAAANSLGGPQWNPNRWTPLRVPNGTLVDGNGNPYYDDNNPASYTEQSYLTPHWGAVKPYALTSGNQFRPPAPPQLGSDAPYTDALGNTTTNDAAYRSQAEEVLNISAELTDSQKIIAEFWADGPGTWTPPGHWMQLANGVSIRDGHGVDEDVRLYMAIAGAVFDAGIVAWEAKRAYDFIRPVSAIRYLYQGQQVLAWGGPDQGAQVIDGKDWQPYQQLTFVTPAFAEFVSGHSTFSAAAAHTLTAFTGSGALYDGVTPLGRDYDRDGVEDLLGQHLATPGTMMFEDGPAVPVVLRWDTFAEAAEEAGISRLYGGIHFQDGNLHGQAAGQKAGAQAYQLSELYWDPFGEIIETIEEFDESGQVGAFTARQVINLAQKADLAYTQRKAARACAHIRSMADMVSRTRGQRRNPEGFSGEAAVRVNQQLTTVSGLLCSGPGFSQPQSQNTASRPARGRTLR